MTANQEPLIIRSQLLKHINVQKAHIEATKERMIPLDESVQAMELILEQTEFRKQQLFQAFESLNTAILQIEALREKRSKAVKPTTDGYDKFVAELNAQIIAVNNEIVPALSGLLNESLFGDMKIDNAKQLEKDVKVIVNDFAKMATAYVNPAYKEGTTWFGRNFGSEHHEKRDQIKADTVGKFLALADSLGDAIKAQKSAKETLMTKINENREQKANLAKEVFKGSNTLSELEEQAQTESKHYVEARAKVLQGSRGLRVRQWILLHVLPVKRWIAKLDHSINAKAINYVEKHPNEFGDTAEEKSQTGIYGQGPVSVEHTDSESHAEESSVDLDSDKTAQDQPQSDAKAPVYGPANKPDSDLEQTQAAPVTPRM